MKNELNTLKNEELEKVVGCADSFKEIPNPVSLIDEEEARKIASELGEGQDMGTWKTMSGEQFMQWWNSTHNK